MHFVEGYCTSAGITGHINQDALCIRCARYAGHELTMSVICDGMGGAKEGEVASSAAVTAFYEWFEKRLPGIIEGHVAGSTMGDWKRMIVRLNDALCRYGKQRNISCGTTLSSILLFDDGRYVIAHVGDSRIYEIGKRARILTEDQSLVADEVRRGIISRSQAQVDSRRNILLECIGISPEVNPYFVSGHLRPETAGILLCTDGFYHEITACEMTERLGKAFETGNDIKASLGKLITLCEERGETDNISGILISRKRRW